MDDSGRNVAVFLQKLQQLRDTLYHELYNQFINRGAKTVRINPLVLSATPFRVHTADQNHIYIGALVTGMTIIPRANKPTFFIGIDLLWDESQWTIENEIEIETDGSTRVFHAFPVRYALTLDTCLQAIDMAADELRGYSEVIIAKLL